LASYNNPHFLGTDWSSNLTLSGERNSENPIFTSRQGDFGFQLERPLNAAGTKTLSVRYDYQQTALSNLLEFAGSRVPLSELFFSGGGSTLRVSP
jgi:hypothetical protein